MGFKKGQPRPPNAGRKAGTPNKKTQALADKCKELGVDPFAVLLDLCKSSDPSIKLSAAKEVCQYLLPKRKAVEVSEAPADEMSELEKALEEAEDAKLLAMVREPG